MNRNLRLMASMSRPQGLGWELSPQALERWKPTLQAAAKDTSNTVSVLGPIGMDYWTGEGTTASTITKALKDIGAENDVTVNINSPGGDLFEGMAIYNLLREHKGQVTVKVLGVAASAASIIAMAASDKKLQVARAGFLMIHDTWVVAVGNRNDLRDVADTLEPFDRAMADVYAARTGLDAKNVRKMMDAETWINGMDAVEQGFADSLLPADEVKDDPSMQNSHHAAFALDMALAKAGVPRSERRAMMKEYKSGMQTATTPAPSSGTPSATPTQDSTPSAGAEAEILAALRSFAVPSIVS